MIIFTPKYYSDFDIWPCDLKNIKDYLVVKILGQTVWQLMIVNESTTKGNGDLYLWPRDLKSNMIYFHVVSNYKF